MKVHVACLVGADLPPAGYGGAAVGFAGFSGFRRAFRKVFGNRPAAYRHLLPAAGGEVR